MTPRTLSRLTRRGFATALVGLPRKGEAAVQGSFVDRTIEMGHRLRDGAKFAPPKREERVPLVIVGGGCAGLCAAWKLLKRGFRDFVLLEMEDAAGGNARHGENEVSAYPWAAHYLPVPGAHAVEVRELCEEFGLLRDGHWDERHLCHSPQERLFLHGRWQEGIEPEIASTKRDHEQFRRFQQLIAEAAASGQYTIPMERGRASAERAKPGASPLDRLTFEQWLRAQGFDSAYLHWYCDYATRDDYGARASETSAWAGIHYFAAREPDEKGPLTWPEGNGWLVRKLMERVKPHVRTGQMVQRIERRGTGRRVWTAEARYDCDAVIFAAPTFLAPYLIEDGPKASPVPTSPWLVANLTLDRPPAERGHPLCWDNVLYGSQALGYVNATHQSLRTRPDRFVWTYYWALADGDPRAVRQTLLDRPWTHWRDLILNDLQRAHRDIRECVSRIDIMRQGHAMPRPVPGFLESKERKALAEQTGSLVYAHSDLSGLALFEEAQYRGYRAADRFLKRVGKA